MTHGLPYLGYSIDVIRENRIEDQLVNELSGQMSSTLRGPVLGGINESGLRRVGPVDTPRLVDNAVEVMRAAILQGRFAPGERLLEMPLAQDLGISRGSLRAVLHMLTKDGLIYEVPRRGKFVQTFDALAINELYSLRGALECFAAELVCARIDADGVRALNAALQVMREAADAGDILLLARSDIAFHQCLIELTRHTLLQRAWLENIAGKLYILLKITESTHCPLQDVLKRHQCLIEGLASGNQYYAKELIGQHIEDARQRARGALLDQYSS